MHATISVFFLLAPLLSASPLLPRQSSCPGIHVFGARETTASPGFGSAGTVVTSILSAHSGATSEAINYPAAGGSSYGTSVQAGVKAVASQVTTFAQQCPDAQIVLVGYSQGAQIIDDALCGGGDPNQGISDTSTPISSTVGAQIKAVIWMGDPRHTPGASYNVGTSTADGFDARPSGQTCTTYAGIVQSYCDQADPYCSDGSDASVHQGYGKEYGSQALAFVNGKLS